MSRMGNFSDGSLRENQNQGPSISHKNQINQIFKKQRAKHQIGAFSNTPTPIIHTISQIKSILYHPFSVQSNSEQLTQTATSIDQLSQLWVQQLDQVYSSQSKFLKPPYLEYYRAWIVSARVLTTVGDYIEKLTNTKSQLSPTQKAIAQYLQKHNLKFVFGRQLLEKKKNEFRSYRKQKEETEVGQKQTNTYLQLFYDSCKQNKCDMLVSILQMLSAIDMITLECECKNQRINNSFMDSLQKIKREQQKRIFIQNYRFIQFKEIKAENKNQNTFYKILQKALPNYMFYKNKLCIRANMYLQDLHQKFGDYQFLEHTHDYIQWMFPNHYGSSFNSKSYPLSYIQSELFYQDEEIRLNMLQSIVIFFDFMGLKLDKNHRLVIQQERRLKDVILICHHNHLRIMRILACLSITGFREIALKLIEFLDINTSPKEILAQERREFQRNWEIYGDGKFQRAKEMCFLQKEKFPETHQFWKEITPLIPIDQRKIGWTSTKYLIRYDYQQQQGVQATEILMGKVENKSQVLEEHVLPKQEKGGSEIQAQGITTLNEQADKVEKMKNQSYLTLEYSIPQQSAEINQHL